MGLEIAKIMDERELAGDDLLDDLIERTRKYEIVALQDKRLIFTRVRTFLEKVFGSFYTTEKKEPLTLITQALVRLKQNPHLARRDEKIKQMDRLMESLAENGLLRLRHGQSEERDFTVISQRLRVQLNGDEKQYEIRRRIPSARKAAEEEKDRLVRYREELKVIEQVRITCKQLESLISQPMDDELKQEAARTVRDFFHSLEQKMGYANSILTGKGFIEDAFIAQLKLESLDLAEEMEDLTLIEKLIFLASLNWYRNQWASRSFNEPDNLVFFMLSRMINRHAPWNPRGSQEVRESIQTLGLSPQELEQKYVEQAAAGPMEEKDTGSISVDRRREKLFQLIRQIYQLNRMLAERKSVEEGNTLLKKFLRPGIRTEVSRSNMEIIAQEIRSQVKMDSLNKFMRELSFDTQISGHLAFLRQALSEGSINLFQQLQAFRVAHGLSNLTDNKEREKLAAFISPIDVVQFLTQLAAGQITIQRAGESEVEISARGSTGESLDVTQRTLSNKGLTYIEAARYINKEFENLILSFDKPDFEARCADCNPAYERDKDHHVKVKQYSWVARTYPLIKFCFGGMALLVSPIMFNLMEGEKEKEHKTIHEHTARFMERVAELEKYILQRILEATELFQVGELDKRRLESQYTSGLSASGETGSVGEEGGGNYALLLEEGVKELFPKIGFELQVLLQEAGDSGEEEEDREAQAERVRTEEERAFDEKYRHLMIDSDFDPDAAPSEARKVSRRSVVHLNESLENITHFFARLREEGYERRVPIMRRDQIVSNIRSAGYFIRDIVHSLSEEQQDVAQLMRKTDSVLQKSREALQRVEVIEEQVEVEKENVEVPLYEIHSILVTLNSTYVVTLQGLIELIAQKQLSSRAGLVKVEQIEATKKIVEHIEAVINTLARNSRGIKLESPKIPTGLRDAMSMNISAALAEINRLKRSQLVIQSCQHPNDLRIYLNVLARELLDRKLIIPLQNIAGTLKKAPTVVESGEEYTVWKPEGEEKISASVFGKMDVPLITLNDVPKMLHAVISIADQLADHLVGRGEQFREKLTASKQHVPEKTMFEEFAERMTQKISGALGQLHAFFVPDKENSITFDPERLDDILRVIGSVVGELLEMIKDLNKNKSVFGKEIEAVKRIAPSVESVRNCVNEYNANYLKQKRSADLARSQTNADKTLIGFCQELQKYDDPLSLEYKILVVRGRVYVALEGLVQRILGLAKLDFNAERKKKYQVLVNELFYMMSHVKTEDRDLPLFRKFTESTLRAAEGCGNPQLAEEVKKLVERGEEVRDWVRAAENAFAENVVSQVYRPGMDIERLRKLSEGI
ncbi:hypothetical protein LLH00_11585 [bacterium]|nr:hypothetical protein [bacterium]